MEKTQEKIESKISLFKDRYQQLESGADFRSYGKGQV